MYILREMPGNHQDVCAVPGNRAPFPSRLILPADIDLLYTIVQPAGIHLSQSGRVVAEISYRLKRGAIRYFQFTKSAWQEIPLHRIGEEQTNPTPPVLGHPDTLTVSPGLIPRYIPLPLWFLENFTFRVVHLS